MSAASSSSFTLSTQCFVPFVSVKRYLRCGGTSESNHFGGHLDSGSRSFGSQISIFRTFRAVISATMRFVDMTGISFQFGSIKSGCVPSISRFTVGTSLPTTSLEVTRASFERMSPIIGPRVAMRSLARSLKRR